MGWQTYAWVAIVFLVAVWCTHVQGQEDLSNQLADGLWSSSSLEPIPPELQDLFPPDDTEEPESRLNDELTKVMSEVVDNITTQVAQRYSFCIENIEEERQNTFQFSRDSLLTECDSQNGNTLLYRMCGQAEMQLYFQNIDKARDLPANINCSPYGWSQGCEPGWAAMTSANFSTLEDEGVFPERTEDPQSCCAGFFCPRGLTCMIPCPLGAYCPMAVADDATGRCMPYGYQVTPGAGQSCGGADVWADEVSAGGLFCQAGSYCPSPIHNDICKPGHYCRLGSSMQKKCTILTTCNGEGRKIQNLQACGILLIVALAVWLLLVYSCSDQLLHIRERRNAISRETAARQAREHVTALERWRKAKDAAKRQASNFSGQLSRTLTRKKKVSSEDSYSLGIRGNLSHSTLLTMTIQEDAAVDIPLDTLFNQGSVVPWSHELYPCDSDYEDLYEPMQVPPVASSGPLERGILPPVHSPMASPMPLAHTRSQIFKYAYGQIEKEKARQQMKPISLKDLVTSEGLHESMEGNARPPIELTFIDLSLTLRGSGKRILSHVTGKFSPGRVTAVMGPSGAGKTTFLDALAGKECNSVITGQVFINGKLGSVHAYKRIIGFVPQDDIVHGSLTVEENLWFSAKYRLPADMPKQERVLVVERIITTLGLGPIRDSLVGTMEKRGVSGGQRKRVNVAMEMVMEPSLLILDEPTSGLDSTSSRLVVQALRREASMGVNVGVVLHQPSYGLFKMFDDVMLLAKGGYTVYLGPVDEIEGYFLGLGFDVPERVNPPDYFMDAMEGIALPDTDAIFDPKLLPVLWMCHKGYQIPSDLQATASEMNSITKRNKKMDDPMRHGEKMKTFTQEAWEELCVYLVMSWASFRSTFSSVKDVSGRKTPGFFSQFRIIIARVAKQKFREAKHIAQDYLILLLAGACLGLLSGKKDTLGSQGYIFTIIAISLLNMIASLRTFSADRLQFWRESASGINRVAYFLAKDAVDHFNSLMKPLIYLCMFYFFSDPRSTFSSNYMVTLALVYCTTGIAYVLAIVMQPQPAQLVSVFLPIVATLVVTTKRSTAIDIISQVSFSRWSLEAYVIANAKRYTGVWLITRCGVLESKGYRLDRWSTCLVVLICYGLVARLIALSCLFLCHRKRQK